MCGICGFIDFTKNSSEYQLKRMTKSLNHRGPDDMGYKTYDFDNSIVGLGHTRLSIIDLSPLGHQPMHYKDYSIVYNGEIYNYKEIKFELKSLGHEFISSSDTEVILHAYKQWGIDCLSKFIGMFAIVILDKKLNKITFIRDRAGVKPFYYYINNGLFLFASEIKAFSEHNNFTKKINIHAVHEYMNSGYISAPNTIFKKCSKLNPGHFLTINLNDNKTSIKCYWDVKKYYALPKKKISYEQAKKELKNLMISSCKFRLVSDVPVGIFLSGGYDSSAVAALLKTKNTKINTFTIGFEDGNNEAPIAKEIANYLGTNHKEYYCTAKEAQDIISELSYYYDEPFGDSSAIPTILVSRFAKKDVTVALSADAGDELFAGYELYDTYIKNLKLLNKVPLSIRNITGKLLICINLLIPSNFQGIKKKIEVISEILRSQKKEDFKILFNSYYSLSKNIRSKLFKNSLNYKYSSETSSSLNISDELSYALAVDYSGYLQNDILTKVDRATMSVSLEGREPFLDHRLVEYLAQLPNHYKYEKKNKKKILKDIVYDYIPKELIDRPKSGFSIPLEKWLKNELRFLINENLDKKSVTQSDIFNYKYVKKLIKLFDDGKLYDPSIIWKLIQFQLWYKKWM